jgi:hypothetical protein
MSKKILLVAGSCTMTSLILAQLDREEKQLDQLEVELIESMRVVPRYDLVEPHLTIQAKQMLIKPDYKTSFNYNRQMQAKTSVQSRLGNKVLHNKKVKRSVQKNRGRKNKRG